MRLVPVALALLVLTTVSDAAAPRAEGEGTVCTNWASPTGSNGGTGAEASPFRSLERLARSLDPGETGCLAAGTYKPRDQETVIKRGGTSEDQRVVIRSAPGVRAHVKGHFLVASGADFVTVRDLDLNGANRLFVPPRDGSDSIPSPGITADHVSFIGNDVTNNHAGICFLLYSNPRGTLIEGNRIHDCGVLPRTNHHHGIYVDTARDTTITRNVIFDNADRGIQLYPDAQRTTITQNVIDGNGVGVIFSGAGGVASNDNSLSHNVISNSAARRRWNVESFYPKRNPRGSGNVVAENCLHANSTARKPEVRDYYNRNGGIEVQEPDAPYLGFTATDNTIAPPRFVDRGAKDFRLRESSACTGILGDVSGIPLTPFH